MINLPVNSSLIICSFAAILFLNSCDEDDRSTDGKSSDEKLSVSPKFVEVTPPTKSEEKAKTQEVPIAFSEQGALNFASRDSRRVIKGLNGRWVSTSDVECFCRIHADYKYIEFGDGNSWSDLNGMSFVLGSPLRFMTNDYIYLVKLKDKDKEGYVGFTIIRHAFKRDYYFNPSAEMVKLR